MADMVLVYRRPAGVLRQSVTPQRASGERAGHPSQVKLGRFLAHVDAIAAPVLAAGRGRITAELIVGFRAGVSLTDGGHALHHYLFPVATRLGPPRLAALFGRKICGPSSLAMAPAHPAPAAATPQFSARMAGSCAPPQWTQTIHDRLAAQAAPLDPGPAGLTLALTTGPGRNWARLCTPLIDAFGPVPGDDPVRWDLDRASHRGIIPRIGDSATACASRSATFPGRADSCHMAGVPTGRGAELASRH